MIHQIFLKVSNKTLEDYPCYIEGMNKWKEFCKEHKWEYKLWTEIPEDILDDDDRFVLKETNKYYFSKVDYLKYIVLRKYGGMYIDLDVSPKPKFTEIMNNNIIIGQGARKDSYNNNVIKLPNHYYITLKKFSLKETKRCLSIPIYEKWKIRFYLRTVGPSMFAKYCREYNIKDPNHKYFSDYFVDYETNAWDTPAVKKQLKNNSLNITIMKIDEHVSITGGKSKKCEGILISIKNQFVMVKITKDKKGTPSFSDKPTKVKKEYIEVIAPPPIEMPTEADLKVVDSLEPSNDIFSVIDKQIDDNINNNTDDNTDDFLNSKFEVDSDHENSNPNEIVELQKQEQYMINENNVKENAITMDDAINYRNNNMMLNLQLESMVGFQSVACKEIAELKMKVKELTEQLGDSVRLEKLEVIKKLVNDIC